MPLHQEPFTFEDLTEIYRREQKSKYPVEVRPDFYLAVRECRDRLKKEMEREYSIDQYSLKSKLASNQLIKFQEKSQQVFEFRFDKIQSMALRAALGNKVDLRKLTPEELEFFNLIVEIIGSKKAMLIGGEFSSSRPIDSYTKATNFGNQLDMKPPIVKDEAAVANSIETEVATQELPNDLVSENEHEFVPEGKVEEEIVDEEPVEEIEQPASDVPETDSKPIESETQGEKLDGKEFVLVRILDNIPEIATSERNFKLNKEDVVTLPVPIAKILIKQNVALPIEIKL